MRTKPIFAGFSQYIWSKPTTDLIRALKRGPNILWKAIDNNPYSVYKRAVLTKMETFFRLTRAGADPSKDSL